MAIVIHYHPSLGVYPLLESIPDTIAVKCRLFDKRHMFVRQIILQKLVNTVILEVISRRGRRTIPCIRGLHPNPSKGKQTRNNVRHIKYQLPHHT